MPCSTRHNQQRPRIVAPRHILDNTPYVSPDSTGLRCPTGTRGMRLRTQRFQRLRCSQFRHNLHRYGTPLGTRTHGFARLKSKIHLAPAFDCNRDLHCYPHSSARHCIGHMPIQVTQVTQVTQLAQAPKAGFPSPDNIDLSRHGASALSPMEPRQPDPRSSEQRGARRAALQRRSHPNLVRQEREASGALGARRPQAAPTGEALWFARFHHALRSLRRTIIALAGLIAKRAGTIVA